MTAQRSTFVPAIESSAGSSVNAASTEKKTTTTPAMPTERKNMKSNMIRPERPIRTVSPEKKIARPAVALPRWRGAQARLFDISPRLAMRSAPLVAKLARMQQRSAARRLRSDPPSTPKER